MRETQDGKQEQARAECMPQVADVIVMAAAKGLNSVMGDTVFSSLAINIKYNYYNNDNYY